MDTAGRVGIVVNTAEVATTRVAQLEQNLREAREEAKVAEHAILDLFEADKKAQPGTEIRATSRSLNSMIHSSIRKSTIIDLG